MHEFVDEDGNFIGGDDGEAEDEKDDEEGNGSSLGPGAGTVRGREDDGQSRDLVDNEGESDETKWRRTS